ncbi:signal-induced proliferation-associated 1-like protein 2 isoform X2 [Antedon mediterranea]|uniref:signal-induced proliferation-associated 1-like protein 2 isoform X2 n=1 Tax=Antedon mediterranea TaxID=105859 RepID=UPI003AF98969
MSGRAESSTTYVHGNRERKNYPYLRDEIRQRAQKAADYYHNTVLKDNEQPIVDPVDENSLSKSSTGPEVQVVHGGSLDRLNRQNDNTPGNEANNRMMSSGEFRATPVNLDYVMLDDLPIKNEFKRHHELRNSGHTPRPSVRERVERFTDDRRRRGSPSFLRRNPKLAIHEKGDGGSALTPANLKALSRSENKSLFYPIRKSSSNSTIDGYDANVNLFSSRARDYGSTSSIDVQSHSGDSFFQMLQELKTENDQRSPAPPSFQELLQGKGHPQSQQNPPPPQSFKPQATPVEKVATKHEKDAPDVENVLSPQQKRRAQFKREKVKGRSKSVTGGESSFLKKIRGTKSESSERTRSSDISEIEVDTRVGRKAFSHYDMQSMCVDLSDLIGKRDSLLRRKNTATGASAASTATPQGSMENLLEIEELEDGDGKSNELVLSCPCFTNEIGGETIRKVSIARTGRSMRRYLHCGIVEGGKDLQNLIGNKGNYSRGPLLEHIDYGAFYYRKYFQGQEHHNYLGIDDQLGPLAISIKREKLEEEDNSTDNKETTHYQYRVIVRTSELTVLRGSVSEELIPSSSKHNTSRSLPHRDILEFIIPDVNLSCLRLATNAPKMIDNLMKIDEQAISKKYKIGILFCKAEQNTEEEMYNNEFGSPAFEEFLDCLGTKVRLKDFEKFRAQLDNKCDSTGTHSLYATYQDIEIMFHVSTMLPFSNSNKQQLLRKRHIGNDIATIIFQEPGAKPFSPITIRSQFQHVFVIVRAHEPNTENVRYSVAVSRSNDVPAFGPYYGANMKFTKSASFAEFLLAKVINGENAVHKSEKFVAMATRTRLEYLKDLAENSVTQTTIDSSSKLGKFAIFDRKKEKIAHKIPPDMSLKGALVWYVQADQWSPLAGGEYDQVGDFSLSDPVDSILGISTELFTLMEFSSKLPIFSIPSMAVIGWTANGNCLKVYFNDGDCVVLHLVEGGDGIKEVVKRLMMVSKGHETNEVTLRRNGLGQLGFHVHFQGVVAEVDQYGFAWTAGLRKSCRLVEICKVAVCTLTHDQMIDLLRTSATVKVVVIPAHEDGSPRKGLISSDYVPTEGAIRTGRTINRRDSSKLRSHSAGTGIRNKDKDYGRHGRTPTTPVVLSNGAPRSTPQWSRPTDNQSIQPNDQQPPPPKITSSDYEQLDNARTGLAIDDIEAKHLRQVSIELQRNQQGSDSSGLGSLERMSREEVNRNLMEHRGSRESNRSYRQTETNNNKQYRQSDAVNHRHRSSKDESEMEAITPTNFNQSRGESPYSNTKKYRMGNTAVQGNPKHSSRDPFSSNVNEEKWYDTTDDTIEDGYHADSGYQDSTMTVSKDSLVDQGYGSGPPILPDPQGFHGEYLDQMTYGPPERYSPSQSPSYQRTGQEFTFDIPRSNTYDGIHIPSNSNLSDHSTQSSGSGHRELGGSLRPRRQGNQSPNRSPAMPRRVRPRSPESRGSPMRGAREYSSQRVRGNGANYSSNSSLSDANSPRQARRKILDPKQSSNESLSSRLRPGVTKPTKPASSLQEDLRKLLSTNELDSEQTPQSLATYPGKANNQTWSSLQRTLSDESIAAGGGPYKRLGEHGEQGNESMFSQAFPALVRVRRLQRQKQNIAKIIINESLNFCRLSPFAENSDSVSQTGSTPAVFPLPDNASHLDWQNLVATASRAFEGSDHHNGKVASVDRLNDNVSDVNELTPSFQRNYMGRKDVRYRSSGGARYKSQQKTPTRAVNGDLNTPHDKGQIKKLAHELSRERSEKQSLEDQIEKLRQDNMRLQEESQTASTQLRKFTEWFFNSIDRQ